ncbi:hypothetical protein LJK88_33195 [Paenibacillus sp. P26]|nr:hypothetical protein LJK88_33195 [Paenibacillus sp. P26]UUZ93994.1 hypothetical protein LJK87_04905 [Paenibacillus sp. P25]
MAIEMNEKLARQWIGYPVCLQLSNGDFYIGTITGVTSKQVLFTKASKNVRKMRRKDKNKPRISGIFGSLLGAGNNGGISGTAGVFGFLGKAWPMMKIGFSLIQNIWPLFGAFKI